MRLVVRSPLCPRSGASSRRRRYGASAVEFACIAPVFILLVFGIIEFGRAMMVANVLTNSAREGARIGVAPGATNTDITSAVQSGLTNSGISATNLVTTVKVNGATANASTAETGDTVSVTVTVPYSDVSWLPSSWYLGGSNLRGAAAMRRE